jgi:hypothetical protein
MAEKHWKSTRCRIQKLTTMPIFLNIYMSMQYLMNTFTDKWQIEPMRKFELDESYEFDKTTQSRNSHLPKLCMLMTEAIIMAEDCQLSLTMRGIIISIILHAGGTKRFLEPYRRSNNWQHPIQIQWLNLKNFSIELNSMHVTVCMCN